MRPALHSAPPDRPTPTHIRIPALPSPSPRLVGLSDRHACSSLSLTLSLSHPLSPSARVQRVLRVVVLIIKMLFLGHMLACLWYVLHPRPRPTPYTHDLHPLPTRDVSPPLATCQWPPHRPWPRGILCSPSLSWPRVRYGVSTLAQVEGHIPTGATWRGVYADGEAADPDSTTGARYLISAYWAVVTMTTVGYGDVTPANEWEVGFALIAMLIAALVFGCVSPASPYRPWPPPHVAASSLATWHPPLATWPRLLTTLRPWCHASVTCSRMSESSSHPSTDKPRSSRRRPTR